jgi:hypothetical protein
MYYPPTPLCAHPPLVLEYDAERDELVCICGARLSIQRHLWRREVTAHDWRPVPVPAERTE